jgi:DMSO/TMAO reductase YedYZ molybdopterin-dependent catalytic subunit
VSSKPTRDEIVAARLRLRERFLGKMKATPSVADPRPLGSGPKNRHGMPQVPVDQSPTAPGKWPVLDLGADPRVTRASFRLGRRRTRRPATLDWNGLVELEQVDDTSDFHCVTGWSKLDIHWRGVRFATVAALAEPEDDATHVVCHGSDGYDTNLSLAEALKDDVLLAHTVFGEPLASEHGGPVRVVTPQLYAWKGAKWVCRARVPEAGPQVAGSCAATRTPPILGATTAIPSGHLRTMSR